MNEKQSSARVSLSNGDTVTLSSLSWPGYVRCKNALVAALKGPVATLFEDVIVEGVDLAKAAFTAGQSGDAAQDPASPPGAPLSAAAAAMGAKVQKILPALWAELESAIDDLTPDLIRGCMRDATKTEFWSSLSAVDWLRLRQAATDVCQLSELLELEKNWRGAAIGNLLGMLSSGKNPSSALPPGK